MSRKLTADTHGDQIVKLNKPVRNVKEHRPRRSLKFSAGGEDQIEDNDDEYITEQQLGLMLNVPIRTLQDWRHRQTGPALPFVRLGKLVRYSKKGAKRLIAENLVERSQ